MFEVWGDAGQYPGLGAFASIFGHGVKGPKIPVASGGSLVRAVQQGLKLSKYSPYHTYNPWGITPGTSSTAVDTTRQMPSVLGPDDSFPASRGPATVPAPVRTPYAGCPPSYWWSADNGCLPWPVGPASPYPSGVPYGSDTPLSSVSGLGSITDDISSFWTNHKTLILVGAAAFFLMRGGGRRR